MFVDYQQYYSLFFFLDTVVEEIKEAVKIHNFLSLNNETLMVHPIDIDATGLLKN